MPIAFLVPSSSGHAALVMPILAPLADFADVSRSVAVTAFQSASGLVNLVTPTSAVIMGGLALSKVGYDRYLKFVWTFLAAAFVVVVRVRRRRGRPELKRGEPVAAPSTTTALGVASEVGTLRSVMVHRPDLAHERLSPTNCHELLFDDVIWVRRARQEFDAFVDLMRSRGVEVLLFHELLAETLADADGARVGARAQAAPGGGHGDVRATSCTAWMTRDAGRGAGDPADRRRDGAGAARGHRDGDRAGAAADRLRPARRCRTSCSRATRARGSTAASSINAMFWPARQHETLNVEAIYRFHPRFRDAGFPIWFGGVDHDWGSATIEGGDMMPVGDGVVLVGQGER